MSLFDCIQNAVEGKAINPGRGREAQALFTKLREQYARHTDEFTANAQAAADVKKIMAARVGTARRRKMLMLSTATVNVQHMQNHRTLKGKRNPADALRIFITGDESSGIPGISPLAKTLRGFYMQRLDQVLANFSRDLAGRTRNKALLGNVARELFGKSTGDQAAKELADAMRETLQAARRDYNAAGGDLGFVDNYGAPTRHDARAIERAGFAAWRDEVWDMLDWNRIKDHDTDQPFAIAGGKPPKGGPAEDFLERIFQTITTDGWNKRVPDFTTGGASVASKRDAARILHFKGGDEWTAYNAKFGEGDLYSIIISAVDGYSRDIASMRVLGPNPTAGLSYLSQVATKEAETAPWRSSRMMAVEEANRAGHNARTYLDLHSGAAQEPVNGMLANFLAGVRATLVSAQLGGAALSAVTDVGFQSAAALRVGIDPGKVIARLGKELASSPQHAVRLGLIADQMANVGALQARYMGEVYTPEIAGRLSDFVMRASGLSKWTEAGRHAFQLEFMGLLADNAQKGMAEMTPALRRVLQKKGFTAAEWDVIRRTQLHAEDGATFLVPLQIRNRTDIPESQADDLATRLMSVIHEQTEFAVPSASLEGQALFLDQTRPGTLIGELARSGFMYKSFGMSVLFNQIRRSMTFEGPWSRLGYITGMAALTTVMGALSLQMKEIAKGRDPQPMNTPGFLGRAILQGGGFGIFGDFISAEESRFGGGIEETLAGPMFGAGGDLLALGIGGIKHAATGEGQTGRNAVNFARYNTPVTGIWYWQSAFQRGLFDNLQRMVDPEAGKAWREAEKRRVKNYGNRSWWAPGQGLPARSPSFGSAFGG